MVRKRNWAQGLSKSLFPAWYLSSPPMRLGLAHGVFAPPAAPQPRLLLNLHTRLHKVASFHTVHQFQHCLQHFCTPFIAPEVTEQPLEPEMS